MVDYKMKFIDSNPVELILEYLDKRSGDLIPAIPLMMRKWNGPVKDYEISGIVRVNHVEYVIPWSFVVRACNDDIGEPGADCIIIIEKSTPFGNNSVATHRLIIWRDQVWSLNSGMRFSDWCQLCKWLMRWVLYRVPMP